MQNFFAGLTVGIIVLQTMVLAPTLFRTIELEHAGKLLRALFPKFFLILAALGVVTLACSFASESGSIAQVVLAAVTILLPLVCWLMVPATNRATDAGDERTFKRLHTLSVLLTVLVLLSNIAIPLVPATPAS